MKRFAHFQLVLLTCFFAFSGCKKIDWRPTNECQVQQFSSIDFPPTPGEGPHPYLFSKTFDASGMVSTMDAYLFTIGPNSIHVKIKLAAQGQTLYLLNRELANDTFLIVTMNSNGRPLKSRGSLGNYYFYYDNKNRLSFFSPIQQTVAPFIPVLGDVTFTYDSYGNPLTAPNAAFEYDYTRTAKQQYYFDFDLINSVYGFRLLQYLNMFPEINSPKHIRIKSKSIQVEPNRYSLNAVLSNHQFDSKGKLVSYTTTGNGFGTSNAAATWYCDNGKQ